MENQFWLFTSKYRAASKYIVLQMFLGPDKSISPGSYRLGGNPNKSIKMRWVEKWKFPYWECDASFGKIYEHRFLTYILSW